MELVAVYTAVDKDGYEYELEEYHETSRQTGRSRIPGMKVLQLEDGSAVSSVDEKTFKLLDGTVLTLLEE